MNKTKGLIMGAILLSLFLIPACNSQSAEAPSASTVQIPADFTTFTEKSNYFNISYPADWQENMYYMIDIERHPKNNPVILSLQIKLMQKIPEMIFIAEPDTVIGDGPCLNVVVEAREQAFLTLDQEVDGEISLLPGHFLNDFKQISRVNTTVNGKKAVIVDFTGVESGELTGITSPQNPRHYLVMFMLYGNGYWRVTCSTPIDDFATWQSNFNSILNSIQINRLPPERDFISPPGPSPW